MEQSSMQNETFIAYVVSSELVKTASLLPSNKKRSLLVHSLIKSLGLLSTNVAGRRRLEIIKPQPATLKDLAQYHDRDYLDFVLSPKGAETERNLIAEWGLEDDCPVFPGLPEYVHLVAGATLTAVRLLQSPHCDTAICWDGGRHHARKSQASGYCYVADCVLALMTLRRPTALTPSSSSLICRPRVMYLDLDLHFSDGVSEAFYAPVRTVPARTLTLSIHHAAPGFFPSSHLCELPPERSLANNSFDPFTLSIPLREGASDSTYARIWPIVEKVRHAFDPDYIILQCGCDGLADDPCAKFNWSLADGEGSFGWCVHRVVNEWGGKKLLLGGGGYNSPNAARAWAYFTSIALRQPLDLEMSVPDHEGFPFYAPSFTVRGDPNFLSFKLCVILRSSKSMLEQCRIKILKNTCARLRIAMNMLSNLSKNVFRMKSDGCCCCSLFPYRIPVW
ncbi:hypothetical protein AX17_004091 [Amanita inopinata Kibby_2008]|nr:hypothetical protein AX17_004091 [Amanita inopinata Kibby_2008]